MSLFYCICFCFFFFFKQKTAYEMRISDWSSDVCSSDLHREAGVRQRHAVRRARQVARAAPAFGKRHTQQLHAVGPLDEGADEEPGGEAESGDRPHRTAVADVRSEEHTSELQSLLRISSAVFCLTNKTNDECNLYYVRTTVVCRRYTK